MFLLILDLVHLLVSSSMQLLLISIFLLIFYTEACERIPSVYQSRREKISGDNGYQITINQNPEKYVPGSVYTLYLMAPRDYNRIRHFQRFSISVESTSSQYDSPQNVGHFQLFSDNQTKFNEECINTISETNSQPKSELFFMWSAPPPGSGCVTFKAMIFEDADHWYADDGRLSKIFCEKTEKDEKFDDNDCCACDEAKYSLIFEGIWSNKTHPKDFPFSLWLTHFSDVIGASHERNFSFWGEGQIASEGFRSLAEWGSVRLMETELRAKSKFLKTLIKASGLWYPNVNTNTSTNFKVDRRHNLISIASMFGPSPDWMVGVNGFNLCLKNCTWIENLVVDLFPYDAGTDNGITYMSPNAETNPRERMYRITTTYPEDPRAPFYDPSKKEIYPLARMYLKREKLVPKNCDDNFLNAQLDVSENTEDTLRGECAVTEYSDWSPCSVSCGKGLRMRTREYRMPQKAQIFECNRQLISKEMCVADVPECERGQHNDESEEIEALDQQNGVCATTSWSGWSSCSATCGEGYKMKTRKFVDRLGRKKCPHVETMKKEKCSGPPCRPDQVEIVDPLCPTTEWSDWSPCSASCGKGVKLRTRLLLVNPELQQQCSSRVELIQQYPCEEVPTCVMDMNMAKVVCMQDSDIGPCQGYFNRWYFDSAKLDCLPFVFGGCRGNRNNFFTAEQCNDACKVVKDAILAMQSPVSTVSPQHVSYLQPVDCVASVWTPWSACSAPCGVGTAEKYRTIIKQAENGGRKCPTTLVKRKYCYGPPC